MRMDDMPTMNLEKLPPAEQDRIERTFAALRARGVDPAFLPDRGATRAKVFAMLPKGSLVLAGETLGF